MDGAECDPQSRPRWLYTTNSSRTTTEVKSKKSIYKKLKKSDIVTYMLGAILTILTIATTVITILYAKMIHATNLCDSEDCLRTASSIKELMNTSADPCDDFYNYVCGRWSQVHTQDNQYSKQSWMREKSLQVTYRIRNLITKSTNKTDFPWAVREAVKLYQSCVDVEANDELGLTPLYHLLDELNLTAIPSALAHTTGNLNVQLAKVKRILWSDVFVGANVVQSRDSQQHVLRLDFPKPSRFDFWDKILDEEFTSFESKASEGKGKKNYTVILQNYMTEVMKYVISNGTIDQSTCKSRGPFELVPEDEITQLVNDIFDFKDRMFNASFSFNDSNYMSVEELQSATDEYLSSMDETLKPKIIWKTFIKELLNDVVEFNSSMKIFVPSMDYLNDISYILATTDDELIESVIWWTVVTHYVPFLSDLKRIQSTVNELFGKSESSQSFKCVNAVRNLMDVAVAWLVVNPFFLEGGSSGKIREMFDYIKMSFTDFLQNLDWIDQRTKLALLDKSKRLKSLIGYADWLFEEDELDTFYEGINLTETTYFDNVLQIVRLENINMLYHLINQTEDEPEWIIDPTVVNAVYFGKDNRITMPAGILQFPFFGLGLEALNYGAIGSILGHEFTHGFDSFNIFYDHKGRVNKELSNETLAIYKNKTQCFANQYSQCYIPEAKKYVNGNTTLTENIADNGGLRHAFQAYQMWKKKNGKEPLLPGFTQYTHEQLLFIAFAHTWCQSDPGRDDLRTMMFDLHSPGPTRVQVTLRNSELFSQTWHCPKGSNMNPIHKCQLW